MQSPSTQSKPLELFRAYEMYLAMRAHFTSEKYNAIDYRFHTKSSMHSYEKRTDRHIFERLVKAVKTEDKYCKFLLSNFIYRNNIRPIDLWNEESKKAFEMWVENKNNMFKHFEEDCQILIERGLREYISFEHTLGISHSRYPVILEMARRREIRMETVIVLDKMYGLFDWYDNQLDDMRWQSERLKYCKYRLFFSLKIDKYKECLKRLLSANKYESTMSA